MGAYEDMEDRVELLEFALHRILTWSRAYPLPVFPACDPEYLQQANNVLKANGLSLDRISASTMRHVIKGVGQVAADALGEEKAA